MNSKKSDDPLFLYEVLSFPRELSGEEVLLFQQALTHKSLLAEEDETGKDYDRLEFLGDSILKFVINEYLFQHYPIYDSGELTKLSAFLLSEKTLFRIAERISLRPFVRTARPIKPEKVLDDVVEALLGASYLVFGFEFCRMLILRLYEGLIEEADASELKDNYKAALQEFAQARQIGLPDYRVIGEEGPAHDRQFEVEIWLEGEALGKGKGSSKKEAGQAAAKASLKKLADRGALHLHFSKLN
ncbi:MAG: ribonuclease III [Candidatus Caenarcaniphilales bacterium]|nr:ribonuclease III [Candidatus Caenarcaniphilales bacterium]